MESLQRRIEVHLNHLIESRCGHWDVQRALDKILVEVENETAHRKAQEGTTNEGNPQRELPL
jgi:hypothetical protein